jgi:DNA-binding transcriptional regulator LsrR (DeoR family)
MLRAMPPPPGYNADDYLSTREVAALWDISQAYVRRLCADGKVPGAVQISSRKGPNSRLLWKIPRTVAENYEVPAS